MNIYSVYIDSSKKNSSPLLIKQGFSFAASVFNFIWAFYYRMWFVAGLTICTSFLISSLGISDIAYSFNIAIFFLFGFFASDLRELAAEQSDLELSDIILASNEEEAEIKYYQRINVESI